MNYKVKLRIDEGVGLPEYKTPGSTACDVRATKILAVYKGDTKVEEDKLDKIVSGFKNRGFIKLRPFERILFGTGLYLSEMDNSLQMQIRARSGLSLKKGLVLSNGPATIDPDYRGEIGVILYNSTPFLSQIDKNERIAQLVFAPVIHPQFELVEEYTTTDREGGFGSTGSK